MQKTNFVSRSATDRRKSPPSPFTLLALAILTIGLVILGVGLAFLLFGPLLLAAGAFLVVFAAFVLLMLLLGRLLRWALARLMEQLRKTAFSQALSPALHALLRMMARRFVAFLLEWLDQGSEQPTSHTRRPGGRYRKRRAHLALAMK